MNRETKFCLSCNNELHGRIDKKFCDDQCRTQHNNLQKFTPDAVKEINRWLKSNRKILMDLIPPEGKTKIPQQKLLEKGFNFNYHTHLYTTKAGAKYVFCYEYGYLLIENNFVMLVKRD